MLYLDTLEPPVSACALADHTGSTYQVAPTNGLSKRGPLLVEVLDELDEIIELELDLMLDEELTTELELDLTLEELTTELEDLTLDELLTTELELDLLLATELEETPQPATTPNGAG